MSAEETRAFEREPFFAVAAAVRLYDDRAKVVGLTTPSYDHFREYLRRELLPDNS